MALIIKKPHTNAGEVRDMNLLPGSGRSPGKGNDNPLWYSSLENPIERKSPRATVHRVTKSQTQLNRLNTDTGKKNLLVLN